MEQLARRLKESLPPLPEGAVSEEDPVILRQGDPLVFWSQFIEAIEAGKSIAVLSTEWPEAWLEELGKIAATFSPANSPAILIPTSGSSGLPKFCIHNLDTLLSSARGFEPIAERFGVANNINVLPQHHVGGMLPVFRSAIVGGKTHFAYYNNPGSIKKAPFPLVEACISVVPTQLRRMLDVPEWCGLLQSMGMVLVGGSACSENLLSEARTKGIRLAPCYGSTETAALVTMLDPAAFLDGASGVGKPIGNARILLDKEDRVQVFSQSNCTGYWPDTASFQSDPLLSNDLGRLDPSGNLHILGRADRVIISGGEKIIPEVVEAAAQASGLVQEAHCFGSPDPDWGNRVELEFTSSNKGPGLEARLEAWLKDWIPPYAVPKSIVKVEAILTNELGKRLQNPDC